MKGGLNEALQDDANKIFLPAIDNEIYSKVKDYSKERHKVITYFEIGKILNEVGGKYGDNIQLYRLFFCVNNT